MPTPPPTPQNAKSRLCARLSWGVLLLGESRFSSVPLLNEAYVPIVGGIQRPDRDTSAVLLAVPRGSLSDRLSCLRTQLPRGLCAPRIRIVGIAGL